MKKGRKTILTENEKIEYQERAFANFLFALFMLALLVLGLAMSSCSVNTKLNKACHVQSVLSANGGGRISVCVVCDSITLRLYKRILHKYGGTNDTNGYHFGKEGRFK